MQHSRRGAGRRGPPVAAQWGRPRLTCARAGRGRAGGGRTAEPRAAAWPAPRASARSADRPVRNYAPGPRCPRRRRRRHAPRPALGAARPPRRHGRACGQWNSSKSAGPAPPLPGALSVGGRAPGRGAPQVKQGSCPASGGCVCRRGVCPVPRPVLVADRPRFGPGTPPGCGGRGKPPLPPGRPGALHLPAG